MFLSVPAAAGVLRWLAASLFTTAVAVATLSPMDGPAVREVIAPTLVAVAPDAAVVGPAPDPAPIAVPDPAPAPPASTTTSTAKAAVPAPAPALPAGKGMWINRYQDAMGGNPHEIVRVAKAAGLTHVYVRLGSSRMGFYGQPTLDSLLPVAHANGIQVIGWDFPYLDDPWADAERGRQMIEYTTAGGHRIDAFSADIETKAEGTNLTALGTTLYGNKLRELAGVHYPLIATVPRPSPKRWFPFAEATAQFNAIAPMVYWINRDPATDVTNAINDLKGLGKPIIPVGQAYDPAIDGSNMAGPPSGEQIDQFMHAAAANGATGVSFWVWNTASQDHWLSIATSPLFKVVGAAGS